jgi:hypothetical protein
MFLHRRELHILNKASNKDEGPWLLPLFICPWACADRAAAWRYSPQSAARLIAYSNYRGFLSVPFVTVIGCEIRSVYIAMN